MDGLVWLPKGGQVPLPLALAHKLFCDEQFFDDINHTDYSDDNDDKGWVDLYVRPSRLLTLWCWAAPTQPKSKPISINILMMIAMQMVKKTMSIKKMKMSMKMMTIDVWSRLWLE